MKKNFILVLAFLSLALPASLSALVLSVGSGGNISTGQADWGSPTITFQAGYARVYTPSWGDGARLNFGVAMDMTGALNQQFQLTGQLNAAMSAGGFNFRLYDVAGSYVETWINQGDWTTASVQSVLSPVLSSFNPGAGVMDWSNVVGFGLVSDPLDVNLSQVNAPGSAIPEPATYAMIMGLCAFVFIAWRRRRLV